MHTVHVREIMSSPVITVSPTTRLHDILQRMQTYQLRRVPVVDGTTVVGIVSRGDIRRAFPVDEATRRTDAWRAVLNTVCADEIMTTAVITVAADATIAEASELMLTQRVSSLPVLDGEQVIGIITESDLFHVIVGDEAGIPEATLG